ncbi:MAG TPA: TlpA disulfide reductase family protein [Terriglobales bacterium]|nr:TlpA disulfide reductase family protein [Terriglobales bacterium]
MFLHRYHSRIGRTVIAGLWIGLIAAVGLSPLNLAGQKQKIEWSEQEKPIVAAVHGLRGLPDDVRSTTTKDLALKIRQLPAVHNKLILANSLADLSTEGDFGHDTLQEVTTTLALALQEQPVPPAKDGGPADPYVEIAALAHYEHMQTGPLTAANTPQLAAALAKLESADQQRERADFTLTDLQGKSWTLKDLRGKVVLVNFWATWCPPCRKEMPDLDALYQKFQGQGLVVLAISDEDAGKVKPFVEERKISYPILLDPGRKVNGLFSVEGIPKSFVYDRKGKLVAQSIDMRTRGQFLEMLGLAGIS